MPYLLGWDRPWLGCYVQATDRVHEDRAYRSTCSPRKIISLAAVTAHSMDGWQLHDVSFP